MIQLEIIESHFGTKMRQEEKDKLALFEDDVLYQCFKMIASRNFIEPYQQLIHDCENYSKTWYTPENKTSKLDFIPRRKAIDPVEQAKVSFENKVNVLPENFADKIDTSYRHPDTGRALSRSIIITSSKERSGTPEDNTEKTHKASERYAAYQETLRSHREKIEKTPVNVEPFLLRRNPDYVSENGDKTSIQRAVDRLKLPEQIDENR